MIADCAKDDSTRTGLFDAIERRDIVQVHSLIEAGINVNQKRHKYGETPLDLALVTSDVKIVQTLLAAGAEFYSSSLETALGTALVQNSTEILLVLIEANIDIHIRLEEKYTFLMRVVIQGHLDVIDKLVQAGAEVNALDDYGDYALLLAGASGHQEIFNYLLPLTKPELRLPANQVLPESLKYHQQQNYLCYADIVYAVARKTLDFMSRAISTGNSKMMLNVNSPGREAALWIAANWGHIFLVRTLLKAGADCNSQTDYRAFASQPLDFSPWTRRYGTHGNYADYRAFSPLMAAIVNGTSTKHRTVVKGLSYDRLIHIFLKVGAPVACGEGDGEAVPLFSSQAATEGLSHAEVIRLLIADGANVNARDCDGNTALILATLQDWVQIVEILIEADAQVDTVNNIGYSALMLATYLNRTRIVEVLQTAGASTAGLDRVELIQAIEQIDLQRVQALLAKGTTPNAYHYQGDSALKLAIITGQLEICRLLIQAGADMEFVDASRRESALLRAVRQGKLELIELLIAANASLNVQGKAWGETALIEAVRYCNLEAVRLLVEAGADVNICDRLGHAALYYVDCQGSQCSIDDQTEMGMLLLDAEASYDDEHS